MAIYVDGIRKPADSPCLPQSANQRAARYVPLGQEQTRAQLEAAGFITRLPRHAVHPPVERAPLAPAYGQPEDKEATP